MKSARLRRSRKRPGGGRAKPPGRRAAGGEENAGAKSAPVAARERAVIAREASVRRRERAIAATREAFRARESTAPPPTNVERLLGQVRDANEQLVVSAVRAQNLSDEAHADAALAKTELEHLIDKMQDANERLFAASEQARTLENEARGREAAYRRLSGRLLHLQDEERRRVARDLHDSTAQRLAALIMNLDFIEGTTNSFGGRVRLALAECRDLASQCSQDVRTLAYLLHPPLLDEAGLPSAVRWYVEGFTKRSGIEVHQDLGDIGRLPGPIETALFRVVQESLTNVHRHASSATASIGLVRAADAVALEVHDCGRGFRDELKQPDGTLRPETLGVGISGMRERITQLGGTFDIAFDDQGTTVRVRVPLRGEPA